MGKILSRVAGLVLLALALPPFISFPLLHFWLLPLVSIYLFLLYLMPRLWLYVLPLATVALDLAPWTGRFTYTELDLVFLATFAAGLLYNRYRLSVFAPSLPLFLLSALLLLSALNYAGWQFFVSPPEATFGNPYYGDQYAYKVFKGLLWGLGLVPMWGYLLAHNKRKAVDALVRGASLAALLLALVILWERGTLRVILSWPTWYSVIKSLLDLTSSYRITGLLSDMHTGGEALDGVVLMLLPCCLYGAVYGGNVRIRLLAAVSCLALAYVLLVGYTRATYAAAALALPVYAGLTLWARYKSGGQSFFPPGLAALTLFCAILAATLTFRLAGSIGLAGFGGLVAVASTLSLVNRATPWRFVIPVMAIGFLGCVIQAHLTSPWVETSITGMILLTLVLGAVFLLVGYLFRRSGGILSLDGVFLLGSLIAISVMIALGLGGTQMKERFTYVGQDLQTREKHWADVLSSSRGDLWSALIGNGVGSFPRRYVQAHPEKVGVVGSYIVVRDQSGSILRLGGGRDLVLGQRVPLEPHTDYTVEVTLRAAQRGLLRLALCERNLIYGGAFEPRCALGRIAFKVTDGAFQSYAVQINSGNVGQSPPYMRWPTILTLQYARVGSILEIGSISLSADGFNLLHNGSFEDGLDHWFHYDDNSHLPWHVKNLWLQAWFETGWLGLGLLAGLIVLLLRANLERRAAASLLPVYTTAVTSVGLFGLFGSPLDSARVSWMFYFFLASGLAEFRVHRRHRHRRSPRGRVPGA